MTHIKTAISLQKDLLEQVENLAREMKVSRSRLFVLAIEAYIRRQQNEQLLADINQAYPDTPETAEDMERIHHLSRTHRRVVDETW